jgi:urease accessory protein
MSFRVFPRVVVALAVLALAQPVFAHEQVGVAGGLASGLLHPLTGMDHLIAMVAVGIWGAQLGAPAIWVLPITFPMPEVVIALSALVLGAAVAMRLRLPFAAAAVVVAVFAVFHGHAHGAELPNSANPLAYGVGFVVATGLLHLCGIMIGTLTRWPAGGRLIQGLGVVIAALGCYFLAQSLGAVA